MYREKKQSRQSMVSAISQGPWNVSWEDKEHPTLMFNFH